MRSDLPEEARLELSHGALLSTLAMLENETVAVIVSLGATSRISCIGTLREVPLPNLEIRAFSVDGRAVLSIAEADFEKGELATFDGNSFFAITVRMREGTLVIADPNSATTDYEESRHPPCSLA